MDYFEVPLPYLLRKTDTVDAKPPSEQSVCMPMYYPRTFRIQPAGIFDSP